MNTISEAQELEFVESVLNIHGLSDEHQLLMTKLLACICPLRQWLRAARIRINWDECHVIEVVPVRATSSRVQFYLYHDTAGGTLGVHAGENVSFCIPEDIFPRIRAEVPEIACKVLGAIAKGHLQETVVSAEGKAYRWIFRLPTELGVIRLDRAMFIDQLKAMFKTKKKRTLTYDSYDVGMNKV